MHKLPRTNARCRSKHQPTTSPSSVTPVTTKKRKIPCQIKKKSPHFTSQASLSTQSSPLSSEISPSQSPPQLPTQPNKPRRLFNIAMPGERIPEEGIVIFEHKVRNWLNSIPPIATGVAIGFPALTGVAAVLSDSNIELLTVLGAATSSALFGSYKAFRFTQEHVLMMRLLQDNIVEFETAGFFGYRRIVQYPANYIYPLTADPEMGHFGYKVKFLPLQQDLDAKPGTMRLTDSGLTIAPDCNYLTGHPKACFDALLLGTQAFGQSSTPTTKRKTATFAV